MNIQVRTYDGLLAPYRVYLYRAIDQYGQVIDVLVSEKRDLAATRRFYTRALEHGTCPHRGEHRQGTGLPTSAR